MGEQILALLRNYLTNRKQRTKLYNSVSDLKNMSIGVPQGSTIGPIMFIIFINDLPTVLEHCNSLMYADNTVVYCAHPNNEVVRKMLQSDLFKVQKWCNDNRLTLNIKKTKLVSFMSDHKRKRCREFKLYMRGIVLEEVNSYKYLGTEIYNRLNGEEQYNKLLQILGLKIRTFGKIRKFLNSKAALNVYKATILPLVDYNDHFQHMWNVIKLGKLQKMQNWGLRIVYGNNPQIQGEEAMHTAAGLMLLSERRTLHMLGLMYHRSKNVALLDIRDIQTRQFDQIKFKVINPVIKNAFKTPNYLGALLWDKLPKETQLSGSFAVHKREIKKHCAEGLFN